MKKEEGEVGVGDGVDGEEGLLLSLTSWRVGSDSIHL
jgi:hypothetical protein